MGFYGNITNINKTTFQFDKIYPNRKEMDDACAGDGVFIGRYVLVDYNEDSILGYVHAQIADEDLKNKPVVVGYQEKRKDVIDGVAGEWQIFKDRFYSGIPKISEDKSRVEEDNLYIIGDKNEGVYVQPGTLLLCLGYVEVVRNITTEPASIVCSVKINNELDIQEWDSGKIYNRGDKVKYREDSNANWTVYRSLQNGNTNNIPSLFNSTYWEPWSIDFNPQIFVAEAAKEEEEAGFVWLQDIDNIWDRNKGRFFINHQIDATFYAKEIGRGWDSTVWQKVYKEGQQCYVMVAELNSVVPTFDISADPPVKPDEAWRQKPYYDADSSNVYYRLHWPSAWGFRIKEADKVKNENNNYISNQKGDYYYNGRKQENKDLAVYWFNEGFEKYIVSEPKTEKNRLELTPTGVSGNVYWNNSTQTLEESIDTYELSMTLPAIGETVSKLWDIIYGKGDYKDTLGNRLWNKAALDLNEDTTEKPSDLKVADEEKNLKIRNTNLQWNTRNGIRAYWQNSNEEESELTYNKIAYNSLAGTINSAHDLMGMIIIENDDLLSDNSSLKAKNADPSNIYYDEATKKYYRKGKKYSFSGSAPIGISGSNMFNPADGNHYKLEAYPFDNYDDIYAQNKESDEPQNQGVIENYYKVKINDPLFENEVYGTLTATSVDLNDLNPENFDPIENDIWWLKNNRNLEPLNIPVGSYIKQKSLKPNDEVKYFSLTATAVSNNDRPVFYESGKYYLLTKTFKDKANETKEQQRDSWVNKIKNTTTLNNNIDFDYLGIMTSEKKSDEINVIDTRNEQNLTELVGYRMLKGVAIDPDESTYIIYDDNRAKEQITCLREYWEGEDYPITEELDEFGNVVSRTYSWNGFSAPLQGTQIIEKEENGSIQLYYKYDITSFVSSSHPELGKKSLQEWQESGLAADELKDLTPSYNFKRELTEPYYTLKNAVDITDKLIDFGENGETPYYYYNENNNEKYYTVITKADFDNGQETLETETLWTLELEPLPLYYSLNKGYYINQENGDRYLRETASLIFKADKENSALSYCIVSFTPETKTPFVPGLYYTKTGNEYTVANTFDSSKTYYRYIDRYVSADSSGIYDIGAKWNEDIVPIPSTVTVSGKEFEWEFQEIPDFAKDINTLHGLILKVNEVLLSDDKVTRDNNTIQGCINLINDILDKFDQLKPAEIVMVDTYGRIHSGDWDTKQKSSTQQGTAPAIPAGEPVAADDERWIKLSTTAGTSPDFKPHIKLEHTFRAGTDTISASNLNTDNVASNNDSDKMQLYTPILDNMGHVVAKNIETVTLPYGFKTVSIGTESNAVTNLAHAAADLVAENTQDTLTINSGNKWMKLAGTANNDSFSIGHLVQAIDTVDSTATDLNNNSTDIINIPDFTYDEAGHLTAKKTHNYTLPYNFKTIAVGDESNSQSVLAHGSGSVVADQVYDTVTLNEGNMWISLAADAENDTINIGHAAGLTASTVGDSIDQTPKFGDTFQALRVGRDIAGHVTTLSAHTVELPTPSLTVAVNPQTQNPQVGNIVTELSLVADEGAFTYNKDYVGNLALTGYTQATNSIASMPQATDSINDAISKLSYVLNNSTVTVNDRITAIDNRMTQWLQNAAGLADVWGVQAGVSAFDNGSLSDSVKYATLATSGMQDAAMQAVLTYGTPQYTMEDGGIKLAVAGKYRVQGSLVIQYNRNCDAIKIAIYKKGITDSAPKMISSITETGTFTDESDNTMLSGVFGISPKIVQLDANDIIYLGAYKATQNGMVTWVENNFGNYLLIEKVDGINTTNQNNGGGE